VSRQMKTLVDMQIVAFTGRQIRKYYTSKNFRQITNLRFQASIQEYLWTIQQLESISKEIPYQKLSENEDLVRTINLIGNILGKISDIYQKIIDTEKHLDSSSKM
ncbi:MAG: hypothetical protein ACW967_11075, partial [Candidatus Hodarchaeales archaeon]